MKTIKILKKYLTINPLDIKSKSNSLGIKIFHIGILLLAAAPSISFFYLLFHQ